MIWPVWSLAQCPGSLVETSWVWLSWDIARRRCRATARSDHRTTAPTEPPGTSSEESTRSSGWWHRFLSAGAECSRSSVWRCRSRQKSACPSQTTGCCCLSCSYTPPTERWNLQAEGGPAPRPSHERALLPARPHTDPPPSWSPSPTARSCHSRAPRWGANRSCRSSPSTTPRSAPDEECHLLMRNTETSWLQTTEKQTTYVENKFPRLLEIPLTVRRRIQSVTSDSFWFVF